MSEPIEVQEPFARKLMTAVVFAVLVVGGGYMLFFHTPTDQANLFSPGELRRVVRDYRNQQTQRLRGELAEMQAILGEMRRVRDQWITDAGIGDEHEATLDEQEQGFRAAAAAAGSDMEQLHDVYDAGRAVEQDMFTVYREFLAARSVGLRPSLSYEQAYESSATPRPSRPELDRAALYRDITTTLPGGGLDEFKQQIKLSTIEMREMTENAKKLLAFTKKANAGAGDGIDVDLSSDDVAMIGYRGPELMPEELDYTHQPDPGNYDAVPGRKLTTASGTDTQWMYVDSWYIIGPFPSDRRRENLDIRFGPEASVNLDDVFTGSGGDKLRWEYKKTGHVSPGPGKKQAFWKIEPKNVDAYSIYYATTELYSDMPREVWIATGTDDYGKLWINDDLIWTSPKERKPYHATENVQLAKLQQGQNKILYRVENAGGTMGFSLMIRLAE